MRAHRCHASLRDACNSAAKLVRIIEKVRNRNMKIRKNKQSADVGKITAGEQEGTMPHTFRMLQNLHQDSKAEGADFQFEIAEVDENELDNFVPGKGNHYGKAFSINTPNRKAFVSDIRTAAWYKKITTWIGNLIEEQHSSQAAIAIVIPAAVSQIDKARKEVFPAGLLCDAELVGSERTWGKQLFEMQLTLAKPQAFTAGVTDYGIAEVRTCIEGQELYIGFPADCVPGNDLIDKVNMLHRLTMQQVQECQSGFRCVLVPGKTLCIPAGYMFCSVAVSDKPTTSIRWGSLNVANHRCCLNALQIVKGMLQTTDGLSDDNVWVSWKDFLEQRCERAS